MPNNCLLVSQIRQTIKNARSLLPKATVKNNSHIICTNLIASRHLQNATHIALYQAIHGEINLTDILHWIWRHKNKQAYLPVAVADNTLQFKRVTPKTTFTKSKYGILEPINNDGINDLTQLDIVLTPLVAFNTKKQRLGMGGGYYDRTFAFKNNHITNPKLIGCAHDMQQNEVFQTQEWDVNLDVVVTEKKWL